MIRIFWTLVLFIVLLEQAFLIWLAVKVYQEVMTKWREKQQGV